MNIISERESDFEEILGNIKQRFLDYYKNLLKSDELTIVDIGCGTGNVISSIIENHLNWNGVGLDISKQMIEICRSEQRMQSRLVFSQHNIENNGLDLANYSEIRTERGTNVSGEITEDTLWASIHKSRWRCPLR